MDSNEYALNFTSPYYVYVIEFSILLFLKSLIYNFSESSTNPISMEELEEPIVWPIEEKYRKRHGPFSHFFDGPFRQAIGGTWKVGDISFDIVVRYINKIKSQFQHEELSIRIFDSICALPEFLGSGDELERNLRFIKELISPVPSVGRLMTVHL
uniref:Uncharacterized protein n=1 Tax=Heterorhabditis bacteriophora TaxID=37862 RepID=A0A1I7W6S2_HETBA